MRVTFNQLRDGMNAINTAASQLASAQRQVATGKRVQVPSDDPGAAQRSVLDQAAIDEMDAYKNVSDSANSRLSALDSALGDIVDKIAQARTALQSSLGSTATASIREAAASTFESVRDAILSDINTTFGGTHLFGGANTETDPYAKVSGTWTYQGGNTPSTVAIGTSRSVAVTVDGQAVLQGSAAANILSVLDSLATAARANDQTTLAAGADQLSSAFGRATLAQSRVGHDESSVADNAERLSVLRSAAATRLSQATDANMAEALTRMSRAQTTYQAALGAVAATSKVSLMDYLK